jgi:hypothetical protein
MSERRRIEGRNVVLIRTGGTSRYLVVDADSGDELGEIGPHSAQNYRWSFWYNGNETLPFRTRWEALLGLVAFANGSEATS